SQVLTLAKSVSQLSIDIQYNYTLNDQIQNLRHDMEMLRSQMVIMKQSFVQQSNNNKLNENHNHNHQQQQQQQHQQSNHMVNGKNSHNKESNNNINGKKVDKIKKDDPPTLKQFLKKFGYEKYLKNFESEKIGITELMLLDEERLQKLGIPMGPRLRLSKEIKNFNNHNNNGIHKQQQQQQQSMMDGNRQQQMTDNFNIYAVV
ncbi:Sterile alpha motif-containing protein, partial [Euroglyphus maynei]